MNKCKMGRFRVDVVSLFKCCEIDLLIFYYYFVSNMLNGSD